MSPTDGLSRRMTNHSGFHGKVSTGGDDDDPSVDLPEGLQPEPDNQQTGARTSNRPAAAAPKQVSPMSAVDYRTKQENWARSTKEFVQKTLFPYIIFTNKDDKIRFGSDIQKIVCKSCDVREEYQELFWNEMGGQTVCRHAMGQRRTTVSNAVRDRVKGTYHD